MTVQPRSSDTAAEPPFAALELLLLLLLLVVEGGAAGRSSLMVLPRVRVMVPRRCQTVHDSYVRSGSFRDRTDPSSVFCDTALSTRVISRVSRRTDEISPRRVTQD